MTLIDRAQHHLFQPLLYQCATGILSEGKIAVPLRHLLRKHKNADFVLAEVTGIDTEGHRVLATRPPLGDRLELGYDYLIVAAGVQQSYFRQAALSLLPGDTRRLMRRHSGSQQRRADDSYRKDSDGDRADRPASERNSAWTDITTSS